MAARVLLLLVVICSLTSGVQYAHIHRLIAHALNTTLPDPSLDSVTDHNHTEYLSINAPNNIFTQADADKMDTDTEQFLMEFYGYNLSLSNPNVTYNPTSCQRLLTVDGLPLLVMLPFKENYNFSIYVYVDTKHQLRGTLAQPEWVQIVYSNLVIYLQDGVVTSGRNAGQIYKARWAITYGYSYYVRSGHDLRIPVNIEKFIMRSTRIGPGQVNAFNHFQYVPVVELTDENGRTCIYWDNQQLDIFWGANNTGAKTRTSGDFIVCSK
ncbi:Hypothetical protein POVR1_LOCUS272 [uncultured virus]|nr:Hypothetical protein POVR1_LOCUS272 [uncultured virus]